MIALGTLMRHVHELMDGAVADIYAEHGLPDYRPRFSPVVRTLVAQGPLAIRDLARAIGVTHSAASQTVVQMRRSGFVTLEKGADARHRIVHLTGRARAALPSSRPSGRPRSGPCASWTPSCPCLWSSS
ncbi:MarR family winged helix-turn-helix transcriptional regulator [Nonomuraea thailandensis]